MPRPRHAERHGGPGDVLRTGHAPVRDPRLHAGLPSVRERQHAHLGVDPSGRNCIDRDPSAGEFDRLTLHERDHGALAGGIVRVKGLASLPRGGGDVDDPPSLPHDAGRGARDMEHRIHVLAHRAVPAVVGHLMHRDLVGGPDPGAVDHQIDAAERPHGFRDQVVRS